MSYSDVSPTIIDDQIVLLPIVVSTEQPIVSFPSSSVLPPNYTSADLIPFNSLATLLMSNPAIVFPPPPVPVPNLLSQHISKAKEDGNAAFRNSRWDLAVGLYTLSAELANSRPLVESSAYARDELAITLCNRSAAYGCQGEWINALCDADAVIALKKTWTKGHFRRGKAMAGLGRLNEARESFLFGLQFDPASADLIQATAEIELQMRMELAMKK